MNKVAKVTTLFWVIKILATTFGETGGDALSMTLNLGYALSTLVFLAVFCVVLAIQIRSQRFHAFSYWAVVVATTTVGTTLSDYFDRTLEFGYVKSSVILFCGVVAVLFVWNRVEGHIEFEKITNRKAEVFYWLTILVSNTLGTALGDFVASTAGLGFERGALIFAALLASVATLHFLLKRIPPAILFWAAYVLTRPLGATLGDVLTKSRLEGGLAQGRILSTLIIGGLMIVAIILASRRERAAEN